MKERGWTAKHKLYAASDDKAVLTALGSLWDIAKQAIPKSLRIIRVHVTLTDLTRSDSRQLDMLLNDDNHRHKWESVTTAIDSL